jgi:hypothetical protein
MIPNDTMPPINQFRSQAPQPPNQGIAPPMQKPGISPGVQALMRFQRPATNNAQPPQGAPGAPGVQPVRPMQQFQNYPGVMPPVGNQFQNNQQAMPPQGLGQQKPIQNPPGQIVDPYMQRRLSAFGPIR